MNVTLPVLALIVAAGTLVGMARAETSAAAVATKLTGALPHSWSIVRRTEGVLPEGHYWRLEYEGPRGEQILLQGSNAVHIAWKDSGGVWQTDAVGFEALKLYVMPSSYRESLLRHFMPKRPRAAFLLIESQQFRIYAYPTFTLIQNEKLERIIQQASATRWSDSPEYTGTLSWKAWKSDIPRAIHE